MSGTVQKLKLYMQSLVSDSSNKRGSLTSMEIDISRLTCATGVGQVEEFERLVQQYLASIPVPEDGEPEPVSLVDITPLPGSFPQGVTTEIVRCAANPRIQHALSMGIFHDAAYTDTELERDAEKQLQAFDAYRIFRHCSAGKGAQHPLGDCLSSHPED